MHHALRYYIKSSYSCLYREKSIVVTKKAGAGNESALPLYRLSQKVICIYEEPYP